MSNPQTKDELTAALKGLRWHKFTAHLEVKRLSPNMTEPPVVVMESVIKSVCKNMGISKPRNVCFQISEKRLRFNYRPGSRFEITVLLGTGEAMAKGFRSAFEEWFLAPAEFLAQRIFRDISQKLDSTQRQLLVNAYHLNQNVYRLREDISAQDREKLGSAQRQTGFYLSNLRLIKIGELEYRSFETLNAERTVAQPANRELCLELHTPLRLSPSSRKQKRSGEVTKADIGRALSGAVNSFFGIDLSDGLINRLLDNIHILPWYLHYEEARHGSKTQPGRKQLINGLCGNLYLRGADLATLMPLLDLVREINAGTARSFGQGHFSIHTEPRPFFDLPLGHIKEYANSLRIILEQSEDAREELQTEGFDTDESALISSLAAKVANGEYRAQPSQCFRVKKPSGGFRMVESLGIADRIVQKTVYRMIYRFFDAMFSPESIGFRKGRKVSDARGMFDEATAQGYQFAVESDIEDFFPSVDHHRLNQILDERLPLADTLLRQLLRVVMKMPYVLDEKIRTRERGLPQGSPLSPLLANLYLDAFDKYFASLPDARLIRFADDFLLLAKTRERAREILDSAEDSLHGLGLNLKSNKTKVSSLSEGVRFLGMELKAGCNEEDWTFGSLFKKTLFISSHGMYCSLQGASVELRQKGVIADRIPLRRIGEVVITGHTALSSAFIGACDSAGIPICLMGQGGQRPTLICGQSREWYQSVKRHIARAEGMSESSRLEAAIRLLEAKFQNYQYFYQRRLGFISQPCEELERAARNLPQATSPEQLMGMEGRCAHICFQALNHCILDKSMRAGKRDRASQDPLNSLLNYVYHLFACRINALLRCSGLDPYQGFLHSRENRYESLVWDLMEPFRANLDRFILRLINTSTIGKDSFMLTAKGNYLTAEARKRFLEQFERWFTHKPSPTMLSVGAALRCQVKIIRAWSNDKNDLSFYLMRRGRK